MTPETIDRETAAQVASDAIRRTMDFGNVIHGRKWIKRADTEDLRHIRDHLDKWEKGDTSEPHINHALTRLAFILARPMVRM